jgi:hypothetical protein
MLKANVSRQAFDLIYFINLYFTLLRGLQRQCRKRNDCASAGASVVKKYALGSRGDSGAIDTRFGESP